MKTTTSISVTKKLAKLTEQGIVRKNTIIYQWVNEMINGKTEFRPVYSQGSSWKNSTLFDRRNEFSALLTALKINYVSGNDAPKGGKTGAFVKITTKIKQVAN